MHEKFEELQRFLPAKGLLDLNLKRIDEGREEGKDGKGKVDAPGQINAIEKSFCDEADCDRAEILERERKRLEREKKLKWLEEYHARRRCKQEALQWPLVLVPACMLPPPQQQAA